MRHGGYDVLHLIFQDMTELAFTVSRPHVVMLPSLLVQTQKIKVGTPFQLLRLKNRSYGSISM